MKKMMFFLGVIAIAFSTRLAAQQTKIFMSMGNEITGSATEVGYEHNLQILSYSQGASSCSQTASQGGSGSGAGACKVSSSDFSFMMEMDRSIIKLKEYIYTGKRIPVVVVRFVKGGGESRPAVYYKITLNNVVISALQESGSSEPPSVSFSLSPESIAWEYSEQNQDGQMGTPLKFSWDLRRSRSF